MPGVMEEEKFSRLPTHAVPTHYNIRLAPNLKTFDVDGQETITLQLKEASNKLKFYSSGHVISSATLSIGAETLTGEVSYDEKWETVEVSVAKEIPAGSEANLSLTWKGKLIKELKGFYRSRYTDLQGNDQYLATTQFEATYARRAFPCWDEPVYKATFDITLVVPKDKTALSNMNIVHEEDEGSDLKVVKYATTPLMSTYLIAFCVGDFKYTETKTGSGTPLRVYSVAGKEEQGTFALECGRRALNFYEDFFGIKYNLPKCDLIAIPDFAIGAMENWGLVTYREICLLVDEAHTSSERKAAVAMVVGHELAHMWFGNLVTMEWWTDLWLKEGFATFMQYLFVAHAYPEFSIWLKFIAERITVAFSLDGLRNSHPIEVPIENPNRLDEIFDAVSYSKAASVIRMLYHFLGHKYKNAITNDLWASMSHQSQVDVASLMKEWTGFMGYPVVSVSSRQEGTSRVLSLSQKRFLSDGSEDEKAPVWKIPISVLTGSDPSNIKEKFLMDKKTMEHTLPNVNDTEFLKLNAEMSGFYRVDYGEEMLNRLIDGVSKKTLGPVDRFNVVSDIFALVQAGETEATKFVSLLEGCAGEDEYAVWSELNTGVGALLNAFSRSPDVLKGLGNLVQKTYSNIAHKLGWDKKDGEDFQSGLLRPLVLGRLGMAGHQPTIQEAQKRFRAHVNHGQPIPPDLRAMIFSLNASLGGEETYNTLKDLFQGTDFAEVKVDVLSCMARSPDKIIQKKALDFGLTDQVRSQDVKHLFLGCGRTGSGQETAWEYYRDNMDKILVGFNGANDNNFIFITKCAIRSLSTEETIKEIEAFFAGSEHGETLSRPVKQCVENIRLNVSLRQRNAHSLTQWLTQHGY